jgi:tetratricopeptide (TPR) repeat protein
VPEREPDDARSKLLAETQLLRENGQAQQALRLLNVALKQSPDDDALLYDAAMAAERLDRTDEMERLLRRVIKLKPDSAQAYNALGYSLADRGVRLPEARTLIEKAVQLAPDDAYIQDSLGWAEFRQGQLGRAQRTLQAAFDKRPDPRSPPTWARCCGPWASATRAVHLARRPAPGPAQPDAEQDPQAPAGHAVSATPRARARRRTVLLA